MSGDAKSIPASVRARLRNLARQQGVAVDQLMLDYAIERFLYRLSVTPHGEKLIVKGATMLRAWGAPLGRPTRDIDFLGRMDPTPAGVEAVVRECLAVDCSDDGLTFGDDLAISEITVENRYPGVRVLLWAYLDGARMRLKLEVGLDDVAVPEPSWVDFPVLLDLNAPRVLAYRPATSIAEKLDAMVTLGTTNSRMKDSYDIWMLASSLQIDGEELVSAIQATFEHRHTPLPNELPVAWTPEYFDDPAVRARWRGFSAKSGIEGAGELSDVCSVIMEFLMPAIRAAEEGAEFVRQWEPGGGWR